MIFSLEFEREDNISKIETSRRQFILLSGLSTSGLIVPFSIGKANVIDENENRKGEFYFEPNAFVQISSDGRIIIFSTAPEVGQGVKTSLPMILADELDALWQDIEVMVAPISKEVYGRQRAGGSFSVRSSWLPLRRAGAEARYALVSAAAEKWKININQCRTEKSKVINILTGQTFSYFYLADSAARVRRPGKNQIKLKDSSEFKLIGTRIGGVDNQEIVAGSPLFGTDQILPEFLFATYTKCPSFGGEPIKANLSRIRNLDGIKDAFILKGTGDAREYMSGVAIVGTSTWACIQAKSLLEVEWDEQNASNDSWSKSLELASGITESDSDKYILKKGNVNLTLKQSAKVLRAFYSYPFIAHATLEPQNCMAWHRGNSIEVWPPTQAPQQGKETLSKVFSISPDKVRIHGIRSGGGFGRRLYNDFICEASAISERSGVPIKLQWTREDDMRHDFYRTGGFHHLIGSLDSNGRLSSLRDHYVAFSHDLKKPVSGGRITENEFPFQLIDNSEIVQSLLPWKIPCGALRAPGSNSFAFVFQSFLHELSVEANRDHVEFLLDILGEARWLDPGNLRSLNTGRMSNVVKLVADKAGWGNTLDEGHYHGLAFYFSHSGYVAEISEISVSSNSEVRVHKVDVAVDVGPIVNLSGAESQCEGAIIDGISSMFSQSLTIENGKIQEGNFDQYPLLTISSTPEIKVHFIQSDNIPTGLGEPALPPIIPSICNAIYMATNSRVRSLPLAGNNFKF